MEGKGSSTYSVIKIRLERVTMRNDTQGGMDLRYEIVCQVVSEGEREGRQRSVTEMLSHLKRGFEKGREGVCGQTRPFCRQCSSCFIEFNARLTAGISSGLLPNISFCV